jgi:hypothetical protein
MAEFEHRNNDLNFLGLAGSYPAGIGLPHVLLRVCALLGLMASDEAARGCSDDTVMAGVVTRHTPDDGALQAPLGRSRRRQRNQ